METSNLVDAERAEVPEYGSAVNGFEPSRRNAIRVTPRLRKQTPTRIVCLGGGTGLPCVLRGLAKHVTSRNGDPGVELTAIVAMSDDGGSSGRLRRARGMLPPGDVRNCLVALAKDTGPFAQLFQYRFAGAKGLAGHAVGNLLLAALTEQKGNFMEAVTLTSALLQTCGRVLPSTLESVQLVAELTDDRRVEGETNIVRARGNIRRIHLAPHAPAPAPGLLQSIAEADLITLGPGSLYSSVLPNLLVGGVAEALKTSRAMKVLVGNLMTQPGETDGMSQVEHVRAIQDHAGPILDAVLINATTPEDGVLDRYVRRGAEIVESEPRALLKLGVIPVFADLVKAGPRMRHDSSKLARCLLKLARAGI